ncbi:MAG: class C beta-lactamase-related serine hydrolase [Alphaproteobacteria bacterium]|nr:MAG: class C beta-lactamase-related serine hydrolase [Alphaproteobacteria bacterium]
MNKTLKRGIVAAGVVIVAIAGYYGFQYGKAFARMANFYDPDNITETFRHTRDYFPTRTVHTGDYVSAFAYHFEDLPETYVYDGKERSIMELMKETGTTGLLVARRGTVLYEQYFQGETGDDRHIQFSVTKSFVSALFGIAMQDGLIDSVDDQVTKYLPEMKGTGYDGVTLRDVLTMSSGIEFTEDYGDLTSDVNRMSMTIGTGGSLDDFARSLKRNREPGTYNDYVSVNTHVLGMIIVRVTGQSLSEYLENRLWKPMGMEHEAYFLIDGHGMEVAMGGLQTSLRDMARMGLLYLNGGRWGDEQLVPADWVQASVTPGAPHLMPGFGNPGSSSPYGYGFQWWTPSNPHGDFSAVGIYDQFIYVDPTTGIVIAKTSANKSYNDPANDLQMDMILTAFQTISAALGKDAPAPAPQGPAISLPGSGD